MKYNIILKYDFSTLFACVRMNILYTSQIANEMFTIHFDELSETQINQLIELLWNK